jgi:Protein of unknown function (DUF2442)
MFKITSAKPLPDYKLQLTYEDGVSGIVDFADDVGKWIFSYRNQVENFNKIHLDPHGRSVIWNDSIDMCADYGWISITGVNPFLPA